MILYICGHQSFSTFVKKNLEPTKISVLEYISRYFGPEVGL